MRPARTASATGTSTTVGARRRSACSGGFWRAGSGERSATSRPRRRWRVSAAAADASAATAVKTLGIVGGIAPASTIEYYRMLFAAYQTRRPDGSAPPVIINSIDLQTMIRLIAADALDEVTAYLAAEVDKLARAGAEIGLFASNTPHVVFDRLQRQSRLPLISIIEATYAVARRLGLTRVGLLGTRFTMQGTAYPQVFTPRGITIVPPDPD